MTIFRGSRRVAGGATDPDVDVVGDAGHFGALIDFTGAAVVRPVVASSGVGRNLTMGGGPGATGADNAGNFRVKVGVEPGGGNSALLQIVDEADNQVLAFTRRFNVYDWFTFGSGVPGGGGNIVAYFEAVTFHLEAADGINLNAPVAGVALTGKVGFFGTTPAVKPTVTGSKGANAALTSLLTGLASLGLVTDSSS